jgi:hypothetical protein
LPSLSLLLSPSSHTRLSPPPVCGRVCMHVRVRA